MLEVVLAINLKAIQFLMERVAKDANISFACFTDLIFI